MRVEPIYFQLSLVHHNLLGKQRAQASYHSQFIRD